ncbi:MAG: hypothetical protein J7L45_02915, partial [Candidatus Aenigmarchaeota archaeon]|nr:hypothetical protein [Candidatus Aenigmarchaeota archaeon]
MKNPKIKPNFEIFYPNMSFDSVIFRSPVTEFEMKILNKDKFVRIIHLLNGEFSLEEISSEADVNLDELKKFLSYLEKYQVLEEETDVRKVTELLKPTFHKIKRRFNERNTPSFLVITLRGLDEIFHEIFREIKYGGIDIAVVDEDEIDINHYIKILKEKNPSFVICLLNSTYWDLCEKINRHL